MNCEVIDLVSILPWDRETVLNSVRKTGRCIVSHEAPYTGGFGAEIAASIQVKVHAEGQRYIKLIIYNMISFNPVVLP